jgi:predicted RNase H-like nuclease
MVIGAPNLIVGMDGCKGGWIVAMLATPISKPDCFRVDSLPRLLTSHPALQCVAIDVPIGLAEKGCRACDEAARRQLGPRRNSVFTAPIRPVLGAASQADASRLRRQIEGKGMTIQAYGILRKVEEVDYVLRTQPTWRGRIREVHPEVCFTQLNGGQPLQFAKKKRNGREERLRLLLPIFGAPLEDALVRRSRFMCEADDIIDAFVGLWTARRALRGEAVTLPSDPSYDAFGIPMEMIA